MTEQECLGGFGSHAMVETWRIPVYLTLKRLYGRLQAPLMTPSYWQVSACWRCGFEAAVPVGFVPSGTASALRELL